MDKETTFGLLVDLHRDGKRQGPSCDEERRRAPGLTRRSSCVSFSVSSTTRQEVRIVRSTCYTCAIAVCYTCGWIEAVQANARH
jgi:hypothetical protein